MIDDFSSESVVARFNTMSFSGLLQSLSSVVKQKIMSVCSILLAVLVQR